ncbi:hypothetical protein ACFWGI_06420 [Streptomyces niveus]|uniref:hypothetical protein n=1 Tax=Streptomyces niveus TaxID=193462 RepID=UPI00364E3D5A
MTTPIPLKTEPILPITKLSPGAPIGTVADELVSLTQQVNPHGHLLARALDSADTPPPSGPRDLTGISDAIATAQNKDTFYFSHPDWIALRSIRQRVDGVLQSLNEQAESTPQAAIQAAKITTLAASLIARHAAKVSAHLDTLGLRNTPGAMAMRDLTRTAENHASRASGLDSSQALDTPRLLITHVHKLTRELRRAEATPARTLDLGLDDPNDPNLDSALSASAASDPELAEASELMTALSNLGGRARRAGDRLTLDVRLHGMVETAQLRGFEMISKIARDAMQRYGDEGRGTEGRRHIASLIFHYSEQRLERMRGILGVDEGHDFGHYETGPPNRHVQSFDDESRAAVRELRSKNVAPQGRIDAQIRWFLAQRGLSAALGLDGGQEAGTQPRFPPLMYVAGVRTDSPVQTRLDLITALHRRVESNPFSRDAHFLNRVKDRFILELVGPPELSADARQADLSADQVRSVALYLVTHRTDKWVTSPLLLSEVPELNLTYAQAERSLAVLQTLKVVGPPNGLEPRERLTVSRSQLPVQLLGLELRLPNLLETDKGAAAVSAFTAPASVVTATPSKVERVAGPPAAVEPKPPTAPAHSTSAEPTAVTATPGLPQRDRSAERRHPGSLGPKPPAAERPTDPDPARTPHTDRVMQVVQSVITGREGRDAAYPAPADAAPVKPTDEAQHNAQQPQQNTGVAVN